MPKTSEISGPQIQEALTAMIDSMAKRLGDRENLAVVGIANGGIQLGATITAELEKKMKRTIPSGVVDITFHRDDIGLQPISKISLPTELPFSIDDSHVLLVDDVLYTGRTVRAALNELFDQGRPETIELAVLFHRDTTRLPIEPDYWGFKKRIDPSHTVSLDLDPENIQAAKLTIA